MPLLSKTILALSFAVLSAGAVVAQGQKSVNAFIFGNSLVTHDTGSDETTVPHWVDLLADARGHGFAVDGRWGFLRNFATDLPPEPQWSFEGVNRAWSNERYAFRRVGFDTIIITPANFIQYQPSDAAYDGENPRNDTPLAATSRLIDWSTTQARGARFYIYEGWAEMASVTSYPPNARGLAQYYEYNAGEYHAWYQDYVARLQSAHSDADITLIPVAPILADILANSALADIPVSELFTDDAPHGTNNVYFLAGMITYAALYSEQAPADVTLPETLHPMIRANYAQISNRIWANFTGAITPEGAVESVPETGLADPSLAIGLNGVADWSTQQPFIDVMKTARPWIGHLPGQWGGWDAARLNEQGYLGPDGWPIAIPDEVTGLEALFLTNQDPGAVSLAGRYRMTWEGQGDLTVTGSALDVEREGDAITFGFRPGEGLVAARIEATDPDDPIRNITVVREDLVPFHEAGAIFNPDWIKHIRDMRMIRFMDWMFTNGSPQVTWDDRPRVDDFSYVWRGVPVEVMVELANYIGADPWFTMPHMADDAYVQAFAQTVHGTLNPRLHAHVEWSNEVWNFLFPQAVWARDQAIERWGDDAPDDAWMQFAGLRAAEVMNIWSDVYTGDEDRLVRIVGTHSGWLGLEETMLDAPLGAEEGLPPALASFDAYAITGYFGFEIGDDEMTETLLGWIADGEATERVTQMLRDGSFAELINDIFPYHAALTQRHGLDLLMYEGGTHVTGHGEQTGDDRLTAFYSAYNYSPEMAALYADLVAGFREASGQSFNAFVDVAAPSQFGSWGALRHLDDVNPRWATLEATNRVPFGGDRDPLTFLHGVVRLGGDVGGTLTGTAQDDILIGGAGDERFEPGLGTDRLHGGAGMDVAVLPGVDADYFQGWDGNTLVLSATDRTIYLTGIEALEFEGADGAGYDLMVPEGDGL